MGQYKVLLPFTRNSKSYAYGDIVELPDAEGEEIRNVGMLINYGIIDVQAQKPDKKSGPDQK